MSNKVFFGVMALQVGLAIACYKGIEISMVLLPSVSILGVLIGLVLWIFSNSRTKNMGLIGKGLFWGTLPWIAWEGFFALMLSGMKGID
jgi:hypothetical protein